jgi:hypothetical protein
MFLIIWVLVGFVMMLLDAISARSQKAPSLFKKIVMFPAEKIVELLIKRR